VSVPVMAKARIGHFGEAEVLQALEVDCIDESEVLTPADDTHHIHKGKFRIPFVCGAKDLGEALRRIAEGAAMIRLKGDAGTGNVVHAVRHARQVFGEIRRLQSLSDDEVFLYAKNMAAPLELVLLTRKLGRLPVTTFAAGGIATPADVSMMMSMGCDGVFVGSGIFKGENSAKRAKAMVKACTFWNDPKVVANVSRSLGKGMVGILSKGETYNYVADSGLYSDAEDAKMKNGGQVRLGQIGDKVWQSYGNPNGRTPNGTANQAQPSQPWHTMSMGNGIDTPVRSDNGNSHTYG